MEPVGSITAKTFVNVHQIIIIKSKYSTSNIIRPKKDAIAYISLFLVTVIVVAVHTEDVVEAVMAASIVVRIEALIIWCNHKCTRTLDQQ